MLLSEVCKMTGLTRRAIQEYENYPREIAIKPTQKNKYGYLLYGEEEVQRLLQLRFLRELGYNKEKIADFFEETDNDMSLCLGETVKKLEIKIKEIQKLIDIANFMIGGGFGPELFYVGPFKTEDMKFDDAMDMIEEVAHITCFEDDEIVINDFTSDEEKIIDELLEKLVGYSEKEKPSSPAIQEIIKEIHNAMSRSISESVICFSVIANMFSNKMEVAVAFDDLYGSGKAEYVHRACMYYCDNNIDNETDRQLLDAVNNIVELAFQKKSLGSNEVQKEVAKIYEFFDKMNILNAKGKMLMMKNSSAFLGSETYKRIYDQGRERGLAWFVSRSIEIYCDKKAAA